MSNPANRRPWVMLGLVMAALAIWGGVTLWRGWASGGQVRASGTVEMDEVDVASMVGGRITRLLVDEGDRVHRGDTLAVLDRGEVLAELRAQVAQAERAAALWRDLRSGPRRQELETARADLAAARSRFATAEADLKRFEELFKTRAIAAMDLDRARTDRDAAAARLAAAQEQVQLLESGYRTQQVQAAGNAASAARAQLEGARSRVGELVLTAPVDGVVLLRNFEPGELAQPGAAVVTLGNPDSLWMRVFVGAPLLEKVRLGAPAQVRVLRQKHGYAARVVEISTRAEFTPRAALTEEEQANLVFGVKLSIAPSGGALKAGLPADALIEVAPAPGKSAAAGTRAGQATRAGTENP